MSTAVSSRRRPVSETELERRRQQRLLSQAEVCRRVGRSRWWIRENVLAGKFPRPVSTGTRSPLWVDSEIDDYIDALVAQRDAAASA